MYYMLSCLRQPLDPSNFGAATSLGSLAAAVSWDGSGRYLLGKHLLTYFNWLVVDLPL